MDKLKLLIIDDEPDMRQMLSLYLHKEGYECMEAENGVEALKILDHYSPSLILVDVMMPLLDGFTLARKIRETYTCPLIFLTARGEEWDRIHGLKLGADDYIVKPFSLGELSARIEAVLRRSNENYLSSKLTTTFGILSFDQLGRKVYVNEHEVSLTLKEYELLLFLCRHPGQVFSREHLLEKIWGMDYIGSERTVDTHIKTLRLKLNEAGTIVKTVWGVGYKAEV
ncbi:response regulator transcription factor [Metabacillus iocasae]|uniref:DNA-binding response OmpR family regulator n=1 Tax=Priestia iocasae TaxID=2291674 RepID=A0ABS2QWH1_9BACI|nr:response regulator transcription factor [Metabacillus iocasae]MBM7703830.1 DNA-binding response OmpR family regulator [Metabacillus iocasae]